jgi:hypothetical protein
MLAKIFASYGINGYQADFVTKSKSEFLKYQGNLTTYDMRVYNNLTLEQVSVLSLAQAQFFEMIMEEYKNAKLGI